MKNEKVEHSLNVRGRENFIVVVDLPPISLKIGMPLLVFPDLLLYSSAE